MVIGALVLMPAAAWFGARSRLVRTAVTAMAAPQTLGNLELLVLLAVLRLGDGAYAVAVRDAIAERTQSDPSRGAVSVTLDRLDRKGLLRSRPGRAHCRARRQGQAPLHADRLQARVHCEPRYRSTHAMLQWDCRPNSSKGRLHDGDPTPHAARPARRAAAVCAIVLMATCWNSGSVRAMR